MYDVASKSTDNWPKSETYPSISFLRNHKGWTTTHTHSQIGMSYGLLLPRRLVSPPPWRSITEWQLFLSIGRSGSYRAAPVVARRGKPLKHTQNNKVFVEQLFCRLKNVLRARAAANPPPLHPFQPRTHSHMHSICLTIYLLLKQGGSHTSPMYTYVNKRLPPGITWFG